MNVAGRPSGQPGNLADATALADHVVGHGGDSFLHGPTIENRKFLSSGKEISKNEVFPVDTILRFSIVWRRKPTQSAADWRIQRQETAVTHGDRWLLTDSKTGRFWRYASEGQCRHAARHLGLVDYTIEREAAE